MAEKTLAVCKRNIDSIKATILKKKALEIDALLKQKDEPFGDVKIIIGNHQLKVNVPKKVDWDNGILAEKYKEIADSGENPDMYIDIEYSLSETAYKKFTPELKEYFNAARTLKAGKPTL
ncbi:MAG: hypothetical protein KGJ90_06400, partial [Patescibacteria group bacterium]|nr:hypothetical protein [Patescibacteria group bacterium]